MSRNPIERALGVWSTANYRDVMLPGLGAVTCGQFCDAMAAEALSRTGAVKVKALEWEDREERRLGATTEKFWRAQTAFDWGYRVKSYGKGFSFGDAESYPTVDAAKAAAQADYERRILSALEPAASVGEQDDEPVAYRVHAPEDEYYGVGPDRLQFHPLSQHDLDNGYRQTPLYTRPAEQAVAWQHMPGCGEDRESKMVSVSEGAFCDPCIAPLVAALNTAGIETVASCCGHGHRPGVIALRDGRELFIAKDFDEARKIDAIFPIDINGNTRPAEQAVTEAEHE